MMNTPIYSFVQKYAESNSARLHMPGHKGVGSLGEKYDITEICGADSLYEANGIIRESEKNAGLLFGADTFYSTEGSSLSIRAMLYLVTVYAKSRKQAPMIAAARNVHKSFVSAAALLDFEIDWIYSEGETYLSSVITKKVVEDYLSSARVLPVALYLTSPDYLGAVSDIKKIAEACHARGVLLIVDNAHGAYLNFLPESRHPIALGADMCADSAHKTLPVLTGGAYLHISKEAPSLFAEKAKNALSLFGSTSPSYHILVSLDTANAYLSEDYRKKLTEFVPQVDAVKARLRQHGYTLFGNEPLKITIYTKAFGYYGTELAEHIFSRGISYEFADPDFLVLMLTEKNTENELSRTLDALLSLEKREKISTGAPALIAPERILSPRDAVMSDSETLPVSECLGRTLSSVTVGCPPAVPIVVSGEQINQAAIECFEYYGIEYCSVVK